MPAYLIGGYVYYKRGIIDRFVQWRYNIDIKIVKNYKRNLMNMHIGDSFSIA